MSLYQNFEYNHRSAVAGERTADATEVVATIAVAAAVGIAIGSVARSAISIVRAIKRARS